MTEDIKALDYSFEQVGKHVKSSKRRYIWKFLINSNNHNVVCDTSLVTSKVKIQDNGKTIMQTQIWAGQGFQYKFNIDDHQCIIIQEGDRFQLRIDKRTFLHLLNQEKSKKEFKNHQQCVEEINVTKNFGRNKDEKINLNICGIDGMKKKKNNVMESQNWKGMQSGANDINYFKKNAELGNSQVPIYPSLIVPNSEVNVHVPSSEVLKTEEFNTMQMLFSTNQQFPSPQKVQTSIMNQANVGKQSEGSAVQMIEEFNTMQRMFATNMQSSMGIPPQPNKTPQNEQFSTMQQLFATQNPPQEKKQSAYSSIQQLQKAQSMTNQNPPQYNLPTDFNTMQNLFKSINPNGKNINDFNTMQQLFSTITPPHPQKKVQNITQQNQLLKQSQQPCLTDFCTLQNLFATQKIPIPPNQLMNPSMMKPENFSTMQNLFATMNINPQNLENDKNVNPLADSTNLKAEDFNTMQNLFKTRTGIPEFENRQQNA